MSTLTNITNITSQSDLDKHCREFPVVLVDFWAPWCNPCKAMNPILEQAAQIMGHGISIVKVNIDDAQELAASFEISSIPSFLLFINGQKVASRVGGFSFSDLTRWIEQHNVNTTQG